MYAPEQNKISRFIKTGGKWMVTIKELAEQRREYLGKIIAMKGGIIKEGPIIKEDKNPQEGRIEGSVKAIKHGESYQYYLKGPKDAKYVYVKAIDREAVRKIVQMEYDKKVINAAEKEYKILTSLLNNYKEVTAEKIYESMAKGKQKLIVPVKLTDAEYIKKWREMEYEPLGFRENSPEYYSSRGERMRSKSEVIIANLLDKLNVEYKYEKPLKLRNIGIVHPDFTLLDVKARKEIFLEHLGMLDDQAYRNNAILKIRDYENSGFYVGDRLIVTEESVNCPIDVKNVERKIKFVMGL